MAGDQNCGTRGFYSWARYFGYVIRI